MKMRLRCSRKSRTRASLTGLPTGRIMVRSAQRWGEGITRIVTSVAFLIPPSLSGTSVSVYAEAWLPSRTRPGDHPRTPRHGLRARRRARGVRRPPKC